MDPNPRLLPYFHVPITPLLFPNGAIIHRMDFLPVHRSWF